MTDQPGYYYHPSKYTPPLGHPQLDIYLVDEQTERFFDAHGVEFLVFEKERSSILKVVHSQQSGIFSGTYHVCAGRILIYDHAGDEVEGFSFGGDLEIVWSGDYTRCTLTSSAPIFSLSTDPQSVNEIIFSEIEAVLAEKRAERHKKGGEKFYKRLCEIDPMKLCVATFNAMLIRLVEIEAAYKHDHKHVEAHKVVDEAIRTLKDAHDGMLVVYSLDELL